jgi:hypothetical protein
MTKNSTKSGILSRTSFVGSSNGGGLLPDMLSALILSWRLSTCGAFSYSLDDNACAESFFKTLKWELDILEGKHTKTQVRTAVFEFIEIYYNKCRRHSAIGYATPVALTKAA